MPERPPFNPRYSPQFQRGYEPGRQERTAADRPDATIVPARTPSPLTSSTPATPATPVTSVTSSTADGFATSSTADGPETPPTPEGSAAPEIATGSPEPADPHRSVWRNPYVLVLLVVGVLLTAVGLQLYYRSVNWMYAPQGQFRPAPEDMVTLQVLWGLAPVLLSAGIFVLLGVGFFAAARWQRDRTRQTSERRPAAEEGPTR